MGRRTRLVSVSVLALLLVHPSWAYAEYESDTDYSVIYTRSSGDDTDADIIDTWFWNHGWGREQFKSARVLGASNQPSHGSLTHGKYDDMTEAGDDSDFIYLSGHGGYMAYLPIYVYGQDEDSEDPIDSISPDIACTNESPFEVGVGWVGGPGVNESRWDTDVEWAVLAACVQLDIDYHGAINIWNPDRIAAFSEANPTDSAAKTWARTMLGTPNRVHSIMGYDDAAPDAPEDELVATEFCKCAFDEQRSVLDSWRTANQRKAPGYNWAYVSHDANRADRLHGVGTGVTADTPANSEYHVSFLSQKRTTDGDGWGLILDGEGGEEIASSWSRWLPSWARSLALPSFAYAAEASLPTEVVAGGTTFTIDTTAKGGDKARGNLPVLPAEGEFRGFLRGSLNPETSESMIREDEVWRVESERDGLNGREGVSLFKDGTLEYRSERGVGSAPVSFDATEAVKRAKASLRSNNQLPADAVVAEVQSVMSTSFDFESDEVETLRPVEYVIRFVQKVDGLVVDGAGAGITVCLDEQGVREIYRKWFVGGISNKTAYQLTAPSQALEAGLQWASANLTLSERVSVSRMNVVWRPICDDGSSALTPVWRIELDDGRCVYVDAVDGAALGGR